MALSSLIEFYESFSLDSIGKLNEVYDDSIRFVDPIHEIVGIDELTRYFQHVCNSSVTFMITDSGEFEGGYKAFMRWEMQYSHQSLYGGKQLKLQGMSFIECSTEAENAASKVVFHQDYYDLGAMIYQHIPVLGFAVRKVNQKLKSGA